MRFVIPVSTINAAYNPRYYTTVGGFASSSAAPVKDLQPCRTRRLYRVITRFIPSLSSTSLSGDRRMHRRCRHDWSASHNSCRT
jgi:hypothetical protein